MYSSFTAKNRELAQRLSKKLQPTSTAYDNKQQSINDQRGLDQKYKQTLEKLKMFKIKNERYQIQLTHDLQRVDETLFSLQKYKSKNQSNTQMFQVFQKLAQNQLAESSQKMGAVRKGLIQDIDKKKKAMKADAIQVIQAQFQQMCKNNLSNIQKKMDILTNMLEQERQIKDQSATYLAQSVGQQILKMQQMIAHQKQQRRNQNKKVIDLINSLQEKLQYQVNEQQMTRQKSQQQIQTMLEQICFKIQQKILGSG